MRRLACSWLCVLAVVFASACQPTAPAAAPTQAAPAAPKPTEASKPAAAVPTTAPAAAAKPTEAPKPAAAAPTTAPAAKPAAPAAPATAGKTLTIAMSQEPRGFGVLLSQIAAIEVEQSMNAYFSYRTGELKAQPWLVEKIPSIADGDWVVKPDGTMEVTWKLRPNIKWHDGKPLTVEDVIFGWQVMVDKDVPAFGKGDAQKISRIDKVDDRTFKVFWKERFVFADQGLPSLGTTARPLPRHILEETFKTDKEKFRNHPYWTKEFIGTGPYRMTEWVPGSHITVEAVPDYFLGKPKIDRIVWRFFTDTNTLVANVLSGQVDVTVIPNISLDQALTIKQQWDRTGDGQVVSIPGFGWDWIALNNQADPKLGDVKVHQALLHAIDRQEMVDVMFKGLNPVADSWVAPRHPLMTDRVKAQMVRYDFNPQKATQLFTEAGWTKASDGVLTNSRGEKFSLSIRTISGDKMKEDAEAIVADFWKQVGVKVEIDNQPTQLIYDPTHLFRFGYPSAFLFNFGGNPNVLAGEYLCKDIPSEANSWSGSNLANYCSKDYDALFAAKDINQTLDPTEREEIVAKLMKVWTTDLPLLPLYYKSEVATIRKGVTGVTPSGTNEGWMGNVHEWDVTR
jgi:peptide/nickel transport system substrate-binding protein